MIKKLLVAFQSTSAINSRRAAKRHYGCQENKKLTDQRSVGRVPSPGGSTPGKGTGPTVFGSGPAGLVFIVSLACCTTFAAVPKIIFDTDMAGDCDDAGALAALHALADLGECEILAVVTSRKDRSNASAAACSAINHWYGRPDIPIGTDKVGGHSHEPPLSTFNPALRDAFPQSAKPDDQMPDALDIYRKALRSTPDKSVTICCVGALSNLDDLLKHERKLVEAKVKQLVVMGGEFPDSRKNRVECNIKIDVPAARNVADNWPTQLIYTGFEVGFVIHCGGTLKSVPQRNPVRRAYELRPYGGGFSIDKGKPAYDQTAVLLAVRGIEPRYWDVVKGGRMEVLEDGHTFWKSDPESKHSYVKLKKGAIPDLTAMIEQLMVRPPLHNPE